MVRSVMQIRAVRFAAARLASAWDGTRSFGINAVTYNGSSREDVFGKLLGNGGIPMLPRSNGLEVSSLGLF